MAIDPRLIGKPTKNIGSLPVMIYDHNELRLISENIWHAQMAGWPKILTYDHVESTVDRRKNRGDKRYANIDLSGVIRSRVSSADEYPFASTVENAGSTWIGHAPEGEQRRQGGIISAFYRAHRADFVSALRPFWFEVKVINYR